MTYDSTGKTSVSNSDAKVERYFWDAVGNYDKKFWDRLPVQPHGRRLKRALPPKSFNASRQDLIDLGLWALGAATGDASAGGSSTEWSMLSYFGRVNLNRMEKYLLEFNLRYDGSSRFQKGRRWGHFPQHPQAGVWSVKPSCRAS